MCTLWCTSATHNLSQSTFSNVLWKCTFMTHTSLSITKICQPPKLLHIRNVLPNGAVRGIYLVPLAGKLPTRTHSAQVTCRQNHCKTTEPYSTGSETRFCFGINRPWPHDTCTPWNFPVVSSGSVSHTGCGSGTGLPWNSSGNAMQTLVREAAEQLSFHQLIGLERVLFSRTNVATVLSENAVTSMFFFFCPWFLFLVYGVCWFEDFRAGEHRG